MSVDVIGLQSGAARLTIAPSLGGSLAEFYSLDGITRCDWFRPASAESLIKGDILGMACIPLVPFSGRIRDAEFDFDGRRISIPKNVPWEGNALHGNGWQNPWGVKSISDHEAVLEFRSDSAAWPWRFRADQRFLLEGERLTISLSLTNESDRAMPTGIGIHPWFPARQGTRLRVRARTVWLVDKGNLFSGCVPVPPHWDFSEGREIAGTDLVNGFTDWDGQALIEWPDNGASLKIEASKTLGHLVIYTPKGEPYFCAEPVSHSVDAFNLETQGVRGNGTVVLQPGESLQGHALFAGLIAG